MLDVIVALTLLAALVPPPAASGAQASSAGPPNIIVFFTDDQGYADVGSFGAEGFETPHLDTLAKDGIRFTQFYVPATVCTPSRAALLTGSYPKRVGLHEAVLFPFSTTGLSPDEYTLAEMLRDGGYATACVGKWHLGHQRKFMPNQQGFDHFYGVPYSNDMDGHFYPHNGFQSPPLPLYRNEQVIERAPDQQYLTKMYTDETVRLIKNRTDEPFFIYLAHNMPHTPLHASGAFRGKSQLGLYGDVIMELDWSVGEIVKALKEEGLYENTLFVFTSDNGPALGSASPLRGKKGQTWEGGQRVPAIAVWPKVIPAGKTSDEIVSSLDLYPTIARFAGTALPTNTILDGRDISRLLSSPDSTKLPDHPFYYYARDGQPEAVRLGRWKLHLKKVVGGRDPKNQGDFPISLYDLQNDIGEQHNVAQQHPAIVKKLAALIKEFDARLETEARPVGTS